MTIDSKQVEGRPQRPPSKPKWMVRLEKEVKELRAELNMIVASSQIERKSRRMKNKIERLKKKYKTHTKYENDNVKMDEIRDTVKQKLITKAAKLKAYIKSYQRKIGNLRL